jgi:cation diffusion facilitator family transporter
MLVAKWSAYVLTQSTVIFSDASETIVHIIAVWFAWYAVRLSQEPPDEKHQYGHGKISFVSAAVEGGLICVAAIAIIVIATQKLITGVELERLDVGIAITAGAGIVNVVLGLYLVRVGRANHSLALEANGKHVLTDAWTSAGAVIGLFAAQWTGWTLLDPLIAILFALNILWEGGRLVASSISGLMDEADPKIEALLRRTMDAFVKEHDLSYHRFRLRMVGRIPHIDLHIVFPDSMPIESAHRLATQAENALAAALAGRDVEVITHLEPRSHPKGHD